MRLAVLGGALTLFLAAPGQAVNRQVFVDAAGESGAAPDITRIQVSNDDQGGITFVLTLGGQPSLRAGDSVFVDLDSDLNVATGAPNTNGADYVLNLFIESGSLYSYSVCKWRGSLDCSLPGHWSDRPATSSSHTASLTMRLPTKASRKLRFWVETWSNKAVFDFAPDNAPSGTVFTYNQKLTPDYDHDGLRGAGDKCARVAGGRFDRNHNGCPGPFAQLPPPRFGISYQTRAGAAVVRSFSVDLVPAGATVVITGGGRQIVLHGSGPVAALARRTFPAGAKLVVLETKPGAVGSYTVIAFTPAPKRVATGCVRPGTRRTASCRTVSRGR